MLAYASLQKGQCNDRKEVKRAGLTTHRKLYGYIRLLQAMPHNVIAFTEAQVSYVIFGILYCGSPWRLAIPVRSATTCKVVCSTGGRDDFGGSVSGECYTHGVHTEERRENHF